MQALVGHLYFKYPEFDAQLLRSISKCANGGAEFGECMASAFRIQDGDFNSWHQVWLQLAKRIKHIALDAEAHHHYISAAEAHLRASEYYRQAEWFLRDDLENPLILAYANEIQLNFQQAIPHLPFYIAPVEIPFENSFFYGYFCQPKFHTSNAITVILPSGYDSYVEELYFTAVDLLKRGYSVLMFDGPGQGQTLRRHKIYMRPDWENVIKPVIDFLLQIPETHPEKIVLMGRSFGGWLAPRAASGESRLAALICDPGQWDLYAAVKAKIPAEVMLMIENHDDEAAYSTFFNKLFSDPHQKFFFTWRSRVHGKNNVLDWIRELKQFTLQGLVQNIKCPTLICDALAEDKNKGQAKILYDALTCKKQMMTFTTEEGAGDHCEMGTPRLFAQRVYDWLKDQFS